MPFGAALSICSEGYLRAAVLLCHPSTPFFFLHFAEFQKLFPGPILTPAAVPAAAAVKRILKGYLSWLDQ